jgi:IS1 family transposase
VNRLSPQKRTQVIAALVEGNSIRATVRMTGVAKNTVTKLLCDLGEACYEYHHKHVRNVKAKRVQCDEIWSFVGSKAKNTSPEKQEQGWGDAWTWTAIDADSKMCITYMVGGRDAWWASTFMHDLASRLNSRIQLSSDGHRVYANAVESAFGADIDYAQVQKIYGSVADFDSKYSPATCIGCELKIYKGNPDIDHISTSFVERQNLTMRMHMRRFTRLTNAFSKKVDNLRHAVALHFMYYNFCRVHQTLRVTPAMEAGLTNHVWSLNELVSLIEEKAKIFAASA